MKEPMFPRAEKPKLTGDGPLFDNMGRQVTRDEIKAEKEKLAKDPEAWREQE